jgi:hypothetical protein
MTYSRAARRYSARNYYSKNKCNQSYDSCEYDDNSSNSCSSYSSGRKGYNRKSRGVIYYPADKNKGYGNSQDKNYDGHLDEYCDTDSQYSDSYASDCKQNYYGSNKGYRKQSYGGYKKNKKCDDSSYTDDCKNNYNVKSLEDLYRLTNGNVCHYETKCPTKHYHQGFCFDRLADEVYHVHNLYCDQLVRDRVDHHHHMPAKIQRKPEIACTPCKTYNGEKYVRTPAPRSSARYGGIHC